MNSIYTPILQVIDKYIGQRYNGNDLPQLNINSMMQGGDKVKGSGLFDIIPYHEDPTVEVIIDAIPFYISGIRFIQFYLEHYGKNVDGRIVTLKLSKVSVLNKLEEIKNHKVIITNEFYLRTVISILNEFWNSSGNNLNKAVEMLINELNSSLLFEDEDKLIQLKESIEQNTNLDMYSIKFN